MMMYHRILITTTLCVVFATLQVCAWSFASWDFPEIVIKLGGDNSYLDHAKRFLRKHPLTDTHNDWPMLVYAPPSFPYPSMSKLNVLMDKV